MTLFDGVLKGHRLSFALGLFCVAAAALLSFFPQQVLRFTVDSVIGGGANTLPKILHPLVETLGGVAALRTKLWVCALAMIAIAVVNGVITMIRQRLVNYASELSLKRLREQLYDHIQRLPFGTLQKAGTGDLLQRCTSDVNTIRRFLTSQISELMRALCLLVFALAIMLPMSVSMTFVSLACVPVLLVFSLIYYRNVRKYFREVDESEGRLSVVLQESLTGVRVVRSFAQQAREAKKFNDASVDFRDKSMVLLKMMSLFWSFSDFVIYAQIAACAIVGVSQVQQGLLSVGTLITFIAYTSTLLWPIRQMGRVLADLGKTRVAMERIDEILHRPIEVDKPGDKTPPIAGDIVFDHVTFGYDDGPDILSDISFHAKQGQTVGILGSTGSGKSTLVLLLQRLYPVRNGRILVDGVDIDEIELAHLRRHVGLVLQEPFLYSRSIKENIGITVDSPSDEQIREVAHIAALEEFEAEFEKGFDTMVGERGVTVSGGQKQRIAMARMLLQKAPIMVFDDSLSALDTQTDADVRAALKKMPHKATTLIISHRINTLSSADMILVLEGGRIVETGTHEELLRSDGLYRRVYALQNDEQAIEGGDHA
jgi:ATP-binding cassette subfamily B protein